MFLEVILILVTIVGLLVAGAFFGLAVVELVNAINEVGDDDDAEEHLQWLEKKEIF